MTYLLAIKNRLKARLGELWWYTIAIFVAQMVGSLINTVIGLWLVPKYVPQQELGAVLPLASIGGLMGLPLTILMTPFLSFLTRYMAQGEAGKVKALLRDVFLLTLFLFVSVSGISWLFMPLVFERMRVQDGSLSALVVFFGLIGALAPLFTTALQALKKFRMISVFGFFGAIIRLITLLVALPIRGLSGYFVGQITPLVFGIVATLFELRKYVGRGVKAVAYWNEDWKSILKFTAWNALFTLVWHLMGTTEGFVIRHRLPDIDSAGYYMISRFAEISFYITMATSVVLFPLIAESHEKKLRQENRLLLQSSGFSCVAGFAFAVLITPVVGFIFELKSDWEAYLPYTKYLFVVCLIHVIRGSVNSFLVYKIAKHEFDFIPCFVFVPMLEVIVLYNLTGYMFFSPWFPVSWINAIAEFNPCRLPVILSIILVTNIIILVYVIVAIAKMQRVKSVFSSDTNIK
jgi:O-antigen/teichoic acid export membrane protein